MILLKPEEMREMDKQTIEDGFPEILLMEAAGRGVAAMARDEVLSKSPRKDPEVLIFAGKGNNGGDGLVAARWLDMWGYRVKIILLAVPGDLKGINRTNYELCQTRGIEIFQITALENFTISNYIQRVGLVIDAMLGTGLTGDVRGNIAGMIDLINETDIPVLAVDIPSGLDGKKGTLHGKSVRADFTATMAFNKIGLCVYPGRKYVGQVKVIDIGMPEASSSKVEYDTFMLKTDEAAELIPGRPEIGHKGSFGKIVVLGGSTGMAGAPVLTGSAALKTGAGLVKLAIPEQIKTVMASYAPELIVSGLDGDKMGIIESALPEIESLQENCDVMAVGPGLGRSADIEKIIETLLREYEIPLVLDADGINAIKDINVLHERKEPIIMTPHPGEMARLIGCEIQDVQANRIETAREFAVQHGVYLVLKGAGTIIALPDGRIFVNPTGNEGMATAGSGDVLTGIISALVGQGLDMESAAVLGTYLHGMAGDFAREELSSYSLTAGDLINYIPCTWQWLENN